MGRNRFLASPGSGSLLGSQAKILTFSLVENTSLSQALRANDLNILARLEKYEQLYISVVRSCITPGAE